MKLPAVLSVVLIAVAACSSGQGGQGSKGSRGGPGSPGGQGVPGLRHTGCASVTAAKTVGHSALDKWLAHTPLYVAHRGGDADWVEGTAAAYRQAASWNSQLALEVPVWRTSDGVWVVSEDSTTGRVFDQDVDIRDSTWSTLATLSTKVGGLRMARLVDDILIPYGSTRILFIDNKADTHAQTLFDLLDSYAGRSRYVSKSYYASKNTASEAHRRGYLTWGYYYARDMALFDVTQSRFDLLGLNYSAPASDFATMIATRKAVIATVIPNPQSASSASCKGASGFMVSGVKEVVHHP